MLFSFSRCSRTAAAKAAAAASPGVTDADDVNEEVDEVGLLLGKETGRVVSVTGVSLPLRVVVAESDTTDEGVVGPASSASVAEAVAGVKDGG